MIRLLYSLLFHLAMPLVWMRLLWRSRRQPEYLRHVGERHGFYPPPPARPLIWLHAVSVGETRAAEPLIDLLLQRHPEHAVLLTHMTPTGRATGRELVQRHPDRLTQAYLPYDLPAACGRFLDHYRPQIGLLMETEIWPNLIAAARQRKIPLALVNARLSPRSQCGYARLSALTRPAIAGLSAIAAQTAADAVRLQAVGARQAIVCGNLKFDVTPPAEKLHLGARWRQALGRRPIWLAASTREGEEALLLDAFARLPQRHLLLLVPRHPQRFVEVAELIASRQLACCRRSGGELPDEQTRVWLGDSMGEMPAYYALADLALIGGTLLPFGGQNLIEAAACGCPALLGPHTFNFAQASTDAIACGAARRVANAGEAVTVASELLQQPLLLARMRAAASRFSQAHQGATERTAALIEGLMAPRAGC
ncbi:MAG: lipid IV(A) 3-deoxy-D-manno-octulosonic acid transferase [Candidatus Accumulibacter sp.]|uniref:lipid IV(A) 3-deoxy-D-manno-octulosonic acid transferase n=1 Tax=Accumulibacter sp. TaxID=2053492 RepID=UPI001A3CC54D|nr:lipid IV(A) 3-deoxy-D-manno-octulosonic acid transferase [Accumulibacter sp.]MBL8390441.1 lipid IV(A) 3-deoxy-D-manno-octulosonic acid transferase [Accumulibacter sp.]HRD88719.1 lipid IV(A) 3-deoxy-D-manno-octulosonic acid transferase [Accumulibacter sp.]